MVSEELYDRLAELQTEGSVGAVFDMKRPDNYDLPPLPILVFQCIVDLPKSIDIQGPILTRENRWQVSVYALDVLSARAGKEAVIAKLHNYRGTAIKRCDFEPSPAEIYESDLNPPEYHIPLEFTVLQ